MQSSGAVRADGQVMVDKIKLAVAVLLMVGGIAGFYFLSDSALVLRVAAIIAGFAAGIAVGWFTAPGQQTLAFAQEAVVETKKVVWPTRKESLQTTGVVFASPTNRWSTSCMIWFLAGGNNERQYGCYRG